MRSRGSLDASGTGLDVEVVKRSAALGAVLVLAAVAWAIARGSDAPFVAEDPRGRDSLPAGRYIVHEPGEPAFHLIWQDAYRS